MVARSAERWQQLLDRLGEVWQTLRGLGVEAELREPPPAATEPPSNPCSARKATLAGLAASIGHPHLEALIRSVAYRSGSVPECTPAFAAVELYLSRTVRALADPTTRHRFLTRGGPILSSRRSAGSALDAAQGAGPPRLFRRRRHDQEWQGRGSHQQRWIPESRCGDCVLRSLANVQHIAADHRGPADPTGLAPARIRQLPQRSLTRTRQPRAAPVMENVALNEAGVPTVSYRRQVAGGGVHSVHNFNQTHPPALLRGGLERLLQLATPDLW